MIRTPQRILEKKKQYIYIYELIEVFRGSLELDR